jgi:hypothetical protein
MGLLGFVLRQFVLSYYTRLTRHARQHVQTTTRLTRVQSNVWVMPSLELSLSSLVQALIPQARENEGLCAELVDHCRAILGR